MDDSDAEVQRSWSDLRRQWPRAVRRQLHLEVRPDFLAGEQGTLFRDGRRAEVCYVLYRAEPRTGLLLHKKAAYPTGCFRLPTGGVTPGEHIVGSMEREVREETSLDLRRGGRIQFLGQLDYTFQVSRVAYVLPFTTYVFTVEAPRDFTPVPLDETEEIEAWRWQPPAALSEITAYLRQFEHEDPSWADWGRFRAPVHEFVCTHWISRDCPTP